jgi:branched-chain amino acid transport system substrate-binding protein
MRTIRRVVPVLLTLSLAALAGCPGRDGGSDGSPQPSTATAAPTGPIKVGVYGSLTGGTATFGQSTKNGVDLAIEEINARGGVKGRMLQALHEDDQGLPQEAAAVVQKLIDQDKVVAVLGEVASSNSLAAAPICQNAGIPMISPSSTAKEVTEVGDYIFRVCFIDPFQGEVMAQFAVQDLGAKTAAVLTDVKSDYSRGLAQFFKQTMTQMGGTIVAEESYSAGDKDFNGVLTKIKSAKPDVIFVPGYYTEAGLIAQQARGLGLTQPLLGGDGWESPELLNVGKDALNGCYYSNHYFAGAPVPRIQEFVAKYKAKYGAEPDSLGALGYDAANVLAAAMERAASLKGSDLRDQIAATKDFPGVCGNITLDENRNAVKPAVVLKIADGAIGFAKEIGGAAPAAPADASAPAEATTPADATAPAATAPAGP